MSISHFRVAGVIIRDKKILLVTNEHSPVYWTPGGKNEESENDIDALSRELDEELGIKLLSSDFFLEYEHVTSGNIPAKTRAYLVKWKGKIKPKEEITNFAWFGKKEFDADKPPISSGAREHLFPKLIKDGHID